MTSPGLTADALRPSIVLSLSLAWHKHNSFPWSRPFCAFVPAIDFTVEVICRNVDCELQQVQRQRAYAGGWLRQGAAVVVVRLHQAGGCVRGLQLSWSALPSCLFRSDLLFQR